MEPIFEDASKDHLKRRFKHLNKIAGEGEVQGSPIASDGSGVHMSIVFGTGERLEEGYDRFRYGYIMLHFQTPRVLGAIGSHRDMDIGDITGVTNSFASIAYSIQRL